MEEAKVNMAIVGVQSRFYKEAGNGWTRGSDKTLGLFDLEIEKAKAQAKVQANSSPKPPGGK